MIRSPDTSITKVSLGFALMAALSECYIQHGWLGLYMKNGDKQQRGQAIQISGYNKSVLGLNEENGDSK